MDAAPSHRRWPGTPPSRGLVFFLHGLGLHAAKFEPLFAVLNELGYDVVAHDVHGHGHQPAEPLTAGNVERAARATIAVYREVAAERPILLGVGALGGFLMSRIVEDCAGEAWVPTTVAYSVDSIPVPMWLLSRLQPPWLLGLLDRFTVGYDPRLLTHDEEESLRFVRDDPTCRATLPLGLALRLGFVTNRFYAPTAPAHRPHAFLFGTEDRISNLEPSRKLIARQPGFRLFEVEGGRFHLHRDTPAVQARFRAQLAAALAYVAPPGAGADRVP